MPASADTIMDAMADDRVPYPRRRGWGLCLASRWGPGARYWLHVRVGVDRDGSGADDWTGTLSAGGVRYRGDRCRVGGRRRRRCAPG